MLQEKLKKETKEMHDRLEELMFVQQIMSKTLTQQQYQQILLTNYLIHRDFEAQVFQSLDRDTANRLDVQKRAKLNALVADLDEVGMVKENVDGRLPQQPVHIPGNAFALGAMYVLEGATLGGNVIQKQLAQNPTFASKISLHYYRCYGPELMEKWKQFVQVLNEVPENLHHEALAGAAWMFERIIYYNKSFS